MKAVDIVGQIISGDQCLPYMVEIELPNATDEAFLRVRETLTRIGYASKIDNTLYQTCHILRKRGKYYIVHFKTLFILDGKYNDISVNDIARQNTIVKLLESWKLIKVVAPDMILTPTSPLCNIVIVRFNDKHNWKLLQKYSLGVKAKSEYYNNQDSVDDHYNFWD